MNLKKNSLCVSCYVYMSFKRIITVCILYLIQHFQPWNIGVFPLNKSAIFHRLLCSHSDNIKSENECENDKQLWRHFIYCTWWLRCSKPKDNVINRKFNDLTLNMAFIYFVKQVFFNMFIINDPVSLVKWIPYSTSNHWISSINYQNIRGWSLNNIDYKMWGLALCQFEIVAIDSAIVLVPGMKML